MKHIIPISVGLSAYNEEGNIGDILASILSQRGKQFMLKEIIVISDGSSDGTVSVLRGIDDKRIKIIISKKRHGQMYQLKKLYKYFSGDVLVQTDADCRFGNSHVIENIVEAFNKDEEVMMCGGNIIPFKPVTLIEKANYTSTNIYRNYRCAINGGDNIFSVTGPILAFKKSFVKYLTIPDDVLGTDKYMYLSCLKKGFKYKFVREAVVNYRLPQTLSDHIRQMRRFKRSKELYSKYFDERIVNKEFKIPASVFIKYNLLEFINHPFLFIYIAIINKYCQLTGRKDRSRKGKWKPVRSTKN